MAVASAEEDQPDKKNKATAVIEKNTGMEYECWMIDRIQPDGGMLSGRTGHPNFISNALLRGESPSCPECGSTTVRPAGPIGPNIP